MAATQYRRILRSPREIAKMRRAGLVVWEAHQAVTRLMQPGVTTADLNRAVRQTFKNHRAESLFLNYGGPPPFPAETCISINEELVHGIPGSRKVKDGDLVKIDTGCRVDGWCGDAAYTHAVGQISPVARQLLGATLGALHLAINLMQIKQRWSQIAREMEEFVEGFGFHVVDSMVGHGIGQNLHEPPQVPNLFDPDWAAREDFELRPGVVIAVEPMVNVGTPRLRELSDQWTQVSADRSLTAHFEHTIALTSDGPRLLTGPPEGEEIQNLPDWLQDPSQWLVW
jgi:methionyl aminopeptidase